MPGTVFDGIFIGLVLISSILAFARGFVRELLSAAAVIAAALGAVWSFDALQEGARAAIGGDAVPNWVPDLIVIVGVFLVIYVAVTVVTASISSVVHRSDQIGFIDRTIGLVFGVARGVIVAALMLIVIYGFVPDSEVQESVPEAATYEIAKSAAELIQPIFPEDSSVRDIEFPD